MSPQPLPDRPNIAQYKKQAKDLLKAWTAGDPAAVARVREHHPRVTGGTDVAFALADAQLVIAREHGFDSWPKFTKQIDAIVGRVSLQDVRRRMRQAIADGDVATVEALVREHGDTQDRARDVRKGILDEHFFDSWDAFESFRAAAAQAGSPVAVFESAVDALVSGDLATLRSRLREHPGLIGARSARTHHATLLHYVGANGVEGFRQRTPPNIVDITRLLLDAGADVNARGGMYGGSDTLGLVATSIHPLKAGVQNELMTLLLDRGATVQDASGGAKSSHVIHACLANGRSGAAEFFAARIGADRLDLEAAAGVGALERVKQFFDAAGQLQHATARQLLDGFTWACQFGRTPVVALLLEHGVDVRAKLKHHGETGLHWASWEGHDDTCAVLLRHDAPLDQRDDAFNGTPLDWALYAWTGGGPHPGDDRYYAVVARLAAAGSAFDEAWMTESDPAGVAKIRADARMMQSLSTPRRP